MGKVGLVEEIVDFLSLNNGEVLVVSENEIQKKWRDSNFEVFSKNKDVSDSFSFVVVDNSDIPHKSLNGDIEVVIRFQSPIPLVEEVDRLVNNIVEENLDFKNKIDFSGGSFSDDMDGRFVTRSFNLGFSRVVIGCKDEDKLREIVSHAGLDKMEKPDFYYSFKISSLREQLQKKNMDLKERDKDIEALERHVERLENDLEDAKESKKDDIQRLKNNIEGLEEEREKFKEQLENERKEREDIVESKDKAIKRLEEEKKNLKKKKEEEKEDIKRGKKRLKLEKERIENERDKVEEKLNKFKERLNERLEELSES